DWLKLAAVRAAFGASVPLWITRVCVLGRVTGELTFSAPPATRTSPDPVSEEPALRSTVKPLNASSTAPAPARLIVPVLVMEPFRRPFAMLMSPALLADGPLNETSNPPALLLNTAPA